MPAWQRAPLFSQCRTEGGLVLNFCREPAHANIWLHAATSEAFAFAGRSPGFHHYCITLATIHAAEVNAYLEALHRAPLPRTSDPRQVGKQTSDKNSIANIAQVQRIRTQHETLKAALLPQGCSQSDTGLVAQLRIRGLQTIQLLLETPEFWIPAWVSRVHSSKARLRRTSCPDFFSDKYKAFQCTFSAEGVVARTTGHVDLRCFDTAWP